MSGCQGLGLRKIAGDTNLGSDSDSSPRLDTFGKFKNSMLSGRESTQFMAQLSDQIDTALSWSLEIQGRNH